MADLSEDEREALRRELLASTRREGGSDFEHALWVAYRAGMETALSAIGHREIHDEIVAEVSPPEYDPSPVQPSATERFHRRLIDVDPEREAGPLERWLAKRMGR